MRSSPLEHDPQRRLVRQPRARSDSAEATFPWSFLPVWSGSLLGSHFTSSLAIWTRQGLGRDVLKIKTELILTVNRGHMFRYVTLFSRTLYKRHPWGNLKELSVVRLVCRSIGDHAEDPYQTYGAGRRKQKVIWRLAGLRHDGTYQSAVPGERFNL